MERRIMTMKKISKNVLSEIIMDIVIVIFEVVKALENQTKEEE